VIIKASRGRVPFSEKAGEDLYKVNVLLNARYTIRAEAFCEMGTKGKATTGDATVDGSDVSVSEVEIKFATGECAREK
jgi:hypothetical protein